MTELKIGVFNVLAAGMCSCSEIYGKIEQFANDEKKQKQKQAASGNAPDTDYAHEIFKYFVYLSCFDNEGKFTELNKYLKKPDTDKTDTDTTAFEQNLIQLCNQTKAKDLDKEEKKDDFITYAKKIPDVLLNLLNKTQLEGVIKKFIDKNKEYETVLSLTDTTAPKDMLEKYLIYCTSKESKLGKIIKEFCQSFPFKGGTGFGLYGGFKLGLDDPNHNIMSTDFQNDFYEKKAEFMVKQIRDFLNNSESGSSQPGILVCPEYDYGTILNDKIVGKGEGEGEGVGESIPINIIPCGNYYKDSGILEKDYTKFNTTGQPYKPVSFNSNANFFRYVFYKNIHLELENDTYEGELDELKKCWKDNPNYANPSEGEPTAPGKTVDPHIEDVKKKKNRVDVFYGYKNEEEKSGNPEFVFIGVHLDSTTDMKDNYKKFKEIIALNKLVKKIAAKNSRIPKLEIIIAGDFNFPYFRDKEEVEGKAIYNIPGFNSDNAVQKIEILYWNVFKKNYKLTSTGDVGVCLKERIKSQMGNDQLWEAKGDKRSYNTDFVGSITSNSGQVDLEELTCIIDANGSPTPQGGNDEIVRLTQFLVPKPSDKIPPPLVDFRKVVNQEAFYPYIKLTEGTGGIDKDKSWLSDHSLVYSIINLPGATTGGARKSRLLRNIKKTNTNNNRNNRKKNNNKSTKKRKMNNRKKLSRKRNKKMRIKSKKN